MLENFLSYLQSYFFDNGLVAYEAVAMLIFLALLILMYLPIRYVLFRLKDNIKTKSYLLRNLDNNKLFIRLYNLLFLLLATNVIVGLASIYLEQYSSFAETMFRIITIFYMVLCLFSLLNALETYFKMNERLRLLPFKGIIQTLKIIICIISGLFVVSFLIGKSPALLLSSLGAASAIIMLVFKDAILGFVAGIQLSANKMLSVGDWLEMPKYGADGEVVDITLTTVKVSNWDNTISTIPAYALISDSFKNWKGMQESGGRRIKRSLLIDANSVKFIDPDLFGNLNKIKILSPYLSEKSKEIEISNHNLSNISDINRRRLTNLGTFRAYLENYLHENAKVHNDFMIMVRQLEPSEKGIPLEVYCFSNDIRWAEYEKIQSDIFDHIYAILPTFDLRVSQIPTGHDIKSLGLKFY